VSLYTDLLAAGVPLENHRSDLYAKVTPASRRIIAAYQDERTRQGHQRALITMFVSEIDREAWYDIPFAFDPFWERKEPVWRILTDGKIAEQ
jgi:hypothetical protein